jgi:hypothetical protein
LHRPHRAVLANRQSGQRGGQARLPQGAGARLGRVFEALGPHLPVSGQETLVGERPPLRGPPSSARSTGRCPAPSGASRRRPRSSRGHLRFVPSRSLAGLPPQLATKRTAAGVWSTVRVPVAPGPRTSLVSSRRTGSRSNSDRTSRRGTGSRAGKRSIARCTLCPQMRLFSAFGGRPLFPKVRASKLRVAGSNPVSRSS